MSGSEEQLGQTVHPPPIQDGNTLFKKKSILVHNDTQWHTSDTLYPHLQIHFNLSVLLGIINTRQTYRKTHDESQLLSLLRDM